MVEYITVTGNNFDQTSMSEEIYNNIVRLTHAVIQEGIGFSSINTGNEGNPPQNTNENAIIYPQAGGGVSANNDAASVTIGQTVTIDVLANDSGSNLTIYDVDSAWTGSINIVNNKLVYEASGSYTGDLDVWYGMQSSNGDQDWAMVTITITDDNVEANDDTASVTIGQTVTIDVLANDSGSNLTIYDVDSTWTGSINIVNNKLVYEASGSYTGDLEVWYGMQSSNGDQDWAMVTITITN